MSKRYVYYLVLVSILLISSLPSRIVSKVAADTKPHQQAEGVWQQSQQPTRLRFVFMVEQTDYMLNNSIDLNWHRTKAIVDALLYLYELQDFLNGIQQNTVQIDVAVVYYNDYFQSILNFPFGGQTSPAHWIHLADYATRSQFDVALTGWQQDLSESRCQNVATPSSGSGPYGNPRNEVVCPDNDQGAAMSGPNFENSLQAVNHLLAGQIDDPYPAIIYLSTGKPCGRQVGWCTGPGNPATVIPNYHQLIQQFGQALSSEGYSFNTYILGLGPAFPAYETTWQGAVHHSPQTPRVATISNIQTELLPSIVGVITDVVVNHVNLPSDMQVFAVNGGGLADAEGNPISLETQPFWSELRIAQGYFDYGNTLIVEPTSGPLPPDRLFPNQGNRLLVNSVSTPPPQRWDIRENVGRDRTSGNRLNNDRIYVWHNRTTFPNTVDVDDLHRFKAFQVTLESPYAAENGTIRVEFEVCTPPDTPSPACVSYPVEHSNESGRFAALIHLDNRLSGDTFTTKFLVHFDYHDQSRPPHVETVESALITVAPSVVNVVCPSEPAYGWRPFDTAEVQFEAPAWAEQDMNPRVKLQIELEETQPNQPTTVNLLATLTEPVLSNDEKLTWTLRWNIETYASGGGGGPLQKVLAYHVTFDPILDSTGVQLKPAMTTSECRVQPRHIRDVVLPPMPVPSNTAVKIRVENNQSDASWLLQHNQTVQLCYRLDDPNETWATAPVPDLTTADAVEFQIESKWGALPDQVLLYYFAEDCINKPNHAIFGTREAPFSFDIELIPSPTVTIPPNQG